MSADRRTTAPATDGIGRDSSLAMSQLQLAVEAEERVRREIAELLHGQVQTRLLVAWHHLGQVERLLDEDPAAARALLAEVRDELDALREREVREASHLLHPSIIGLGLVPALRSLTRRFERTCPITLAVDPALVQLDSPLASAIPEPVRLVAYRVVEEALANVARHADARHVEVALALTPDGQLDISVHDDGRGFDPAALTPGLGLGSIAGRVVPLGGTWRLSSQPGRGCTLSVQLPLLLRDT